MSQLKTIAPVLLALLLAITPHTPAQDPRDVRNEVILQTMELRFAELELREVDRLLRDLDSRIEALSNELESIREERSAAEIRRDDRDLEAIRKAEAAAGLQLHRLRAERESTGSSHRQLVTRIQPLQQRLPHRLN